MPGILQQQQPSQFSLSNLISQLFQGQQQQPTSSVLGQIPKDSQTIAPPNILGQQQQIQNQVVSGLGNMTGISDAYRALTGRMTPEEAQMFALGAIPMLGGPEGKAAQTVAHEVPQSILEALGSYARGNLPSAGVRKAVQGEGWSMPNRINSMKYDVQVVDPSGKYHLINNGDY